VVLVLMVMFLPRGLAGIGVPVRWRKKKDRHG
jgi:hypothetical protein